MPFWRSLIAGLATRPAEARPVLKPTLPAKADGRADLDSPETPYAILPYLRGPASRGPDLQSYTAKLGLLSNVC
jgi:hypothetical protein